MNKRIMIMAGGTGGHVFPALAVALYFKKQGWTVTWLGTEKGLEAKVVHLESIEMDTLSITGLRGKGFFSKIKSVLLLFLACVQAIKHLHRRKPNVVLGMGGFVAAPGGLMTKLLGIPLVIHEQNRVAGTTNRILAKFATEVLQAFPDSFKSLKNVKTTGNPLRDEFIKLASERTVSLNETLNVLVVGGSQGAQILNQVVPKAVALLDNIHVKHQTGSVMFEEVKQSYQSLDINAQTFDFIEDIAKAYLWADLIICRSGAMTVSEIAAMGLAAIFIPLPHAIDDHQTANAKFLTEAGAGLLIEQKDLTPQVLAESIKQIAAQRNDMSKKARDKARLQATEDVANVCIAKAN